MAERGQRAERSAWRHLAAIAVLLAAGPAMLAPSAPAHAKALEQAECSALDGELAALEASGVKDDVEKGVTWGRFNLSSDRISRIKHYLEVREKVLFRCPSLPAKAMAGISTTAAAAGDGAAQPAPAAKKKSSTDGGTTARQKTR
ncbi:MAG: hypothetical protein R3D33_06560 [Hyphomicrobiaceae bacterium]